MATSRSIRETLLKHLFLNPHPQSRSTYQKARPCLYPSEVEFIRFLRTDSEQEMVQHARGILLDLIFTSSCPPPSHLLLNLLHSQQDTQETVEPGDYVPRDHFVHLVHLYLLGIYLFAYHENLFRRCSADLNRQKRMVMSPNARPKALSPYELFAVVWKQFVLYHDLGYPLEQIRPSERSGPAAARLKPFTRITKSIDKDLSFKAIGRLVAVKTLLAEEHHATFEEMFIAHHSLITVDDTRVISVLTNDTEANARYEALLERWRGAVYLPNVTGPHDLQTVFCLLPGLDICAFLEDPTGSGEVALFGPVEAAEYFPSPKHKLTVAVRRLLAEQDARTAWSQAQVPAAGYRWHYFAIDAKGQYDAAVQEIFGSNLPKFSTLVKSVESEHSYRTLQTRGVDTAIRLSALAYLWIVRRRGYIQYEEDEPDAFAEVRGKFVALAKSREAVVDKIPTMISRVLETAANEFVKKRSSYLISLLDKSDSDEVAGAVLGGLLEGKERSRIRSQFAQAIKSGIVQPLEVSVAVKECTNMCRGRLDKGLSFVRKDNVDPLRGIAIDERFTLASALTNAAFTGEVDRLLDRYGFPSFAKIVAGYLPPRVEKDKKTYPDSSAYCDHGFVSAIIALTAGWEYEACATLLKPDPPKKALDYRGLAKLAFGSWSTQDAESLTCDARLLRTLVAETILLHNMYPADLKIAAAGGRSKADFKTRLGTHPFAFLALLVDGLQRWDRQCLIDQTTSQLSGFIPGSRYNLEIGSDQMLRIWLLDARLDMRYCEESLRSTLGAYLENADSIIKLQLEEA